MPGLFVQLIFIVLVMEMMALASFAEYALDEWERRNGA